MAKGGKKNCHKRPADGRKWTTKITKCEKKTGQLQKNGYPLLLHLFASAHPAPDLSHYGTSMSGRSDTEFLLKLCELGLVPVEADRLQASALGLSAILVYHKNESSKLATKRITAIFDDQSREWGESLNAQARGLHQSPSGRFPPHTKTSVSTPILNFL